MVAFLGPRVREVDADGGERLFRELPVHYIDNVMVDYPHVAEVVLDDTIQQTADAGPMHLHGQIVIVGMLPCQPERGLAHTGTDIQHPRRMTAENLIKVQCLIAVVNAEFPPVPVNGTRLRPGQPALSQNVTFNPRPQLKKVPSIGDDALA